MTLTPTEESLLRQAIGLATRARESGNPPFGSLLADRHGRVLAEQTNSTLTDDDITAHPELKLARWAAQHVERGVATMYTSCEPCGMCAGAIARSGIARVVFALSGEQLGDVRPADAPSPIASWDVDGPHLYPAGTEPFVGYY